MKVSIIGNGFSKDAGQGVNKCCGYLYEGLENSEDFTVEKIKLSESEKPLDMIKSSTLDVFRKTLFKKSDLYHFMIPVMAAPCIIKSPSIVTVYDVIPLILKNERKKSFNLYFKLMIGFVKRATHIIAISKSTKEDLIKYLGIDEDKITIIYPGVDHDIFYPTHEKKNETFTVGFLGGLVKRKNAKILLDVAEILKNDNIIFKIGGKGLGFDELVIEKEKRGLDNVEFLGFIPDKDLNDFYNSLNVFVAPTIYDGFCMPGLEAMATGRPVILGNTSALKEVAGNAGIKVDPQSAEDIAVEIRKMYESKELQAELSALSFVHANKFSWERNLKETIELYRRILNETNKTN